MLTCEEFNNEYPINIGNYGEKFHETQYAQVINSKTNKQLTFLTPELKLKYNWKFTTETSRTRKRDLYIYLTTNENSIELQNTLKELETKITNEMKKDNIHLSGRYTNKNQLHFKFYNINLSVMNGGNNVLERNIISTSIDNNLSDINQYLTYNSRVKIAFNVSIQKTKSRWKENFNYEIRLACNKILVLDGKIPENSIVTKPNVFDPNLKKSFETKKKKNILLEFEVYEPESEKNMMIQPEPEEGPMMIPEPIEDPNIEVPPKIEEIKIKPVKNISSQMLQVRQYKKIHNYDHNSTFVSI
jgi:hypothetical protein